MSDNPASSSSSVRCFAITTTSVVVLAHGHLGLDHKGPVAAHGDVFVVDSDCVARRHVRTVDPDSASGHRDVPRREVALTVDQTSRSLGLVTAVFLLSVSATL